MQIDRALVHGRQTGAKLHERLGGKPERDLDDVRLLKVKGPIELDAGLGLAAPQMILDDRHQVLAQLLDRGERERVDDGQALGEGVVADLVGDPPRKVVAVGRRERPVPEEVAEGVEEDRARRHLGDPMHELALVEGVHVERLAQLDAPGEAKWARGGARRHRVTTPSRTPCGARAPGRRARRSRGTPRRSAWPRRES